MGFFNSERNKKDDIQIEYYENGQKNGKEIIKMAIQMVNVSDITKMVKNVNKGNIKMESEMVKKLGGSQMVN